MANVFDYIFNIGGNYSATINGMSAATGEFLAKVNGAQSSIGKLTTMLAAVDLVKNAIDGLSQATESLSVSGVQLNSQMHDLSAVAGIFIQCVSITFLPEAKEYPVCFHSGSWT